MELRPVLGFSVFTIGLVALAALAPHESPGVAELPTAPAVRPAPVGAELPRAGSAGDGTHVPLLLQQPALSQTQIAFAFAGQIWVVAREGGVARRLVLGQGRCSGPVFSPDGKQIAFTSVVDGNQDVYVVPAAGGQPTRVTYHPGGETALGFTPDGTRVLFSSARATVRDLPKLFTAPLQGGFPTELPLPSGSAASYSPDGSRLAYVPIVQWQPGWKKYGGGQAATIWLADLSDSKILKIPHDKGNDRSPMWGGDTVYFVSDRAGPATLYAYDTKGATVKELVPNPNGFDVRSAQLGPGGIVYEQLGALSIYDLASGKSHKVNVQIADELPDTRPHMDHVDGSQVLHAAISPTGKRVLVEARGEILSIPAEKGDVRNLTRTPGVADRDPAWSPDGKWIAWLSDEGGEYSLYFRAPDGMGPTKKVDLGTPGSFFYAPRWSPDSKHLTLMDKRLQLWLIDLEQKTPQKIDTDRFEGAAFDVTWSPDSRSIAYVKQLENHLRGVFVYSLDDKKAWQLTDNRADSIAPRFDRNGKYLYFVSRTDVGLALGGGEMSAMGRAVTGSVYAAVLQKDAPSPLAPESDEEKGKDPKDKDPKDKDGKDKEGDKKVRIDREGIDQRIVALPLERGSYTALEAGPEGVLFAASGPTVLSDEDYFDVGDEGPELSITRFEWKTKKGEKFLEKVDGYDPGNGALVTFLVSADGSKVLYAANKKWSLVSSDKAPKPGEGGLKIDGTELMVEPRAEYMQIYREIWRIQRDFLYDPKAHGLDIAAAEKLYEPFVAGVASRSDLNVLFEDMLSNLVLGHVWAFGGAMPKQERVSVGLLGADYEVDGDRYRIKRILRGENYNPKLRAPLTQPGLDVKEGDYILAVNGQELHAGDDIDRALSGRAGKQTVLSLSASPKGGGGARQVTVVPTGSDTSLRLRTWMEDNKKKVDALSDGRVGYVFLPDTAAGGFTNFNRYYFSQIGKDAVVIDERFNHGGYIADYIVNILQWTPYMGAATREGDDVTMPAQAIFGPKVMIANEMSGSGGDALPWLFKRAGIGPLVGTRTWGGLVGIGGYPKLIDGGGVTAPRWALYGTKGEWEVENRGIAPDVEIIQDPALVRQGHDPQLEKAVALALEALAKSPPKKLVRPPYPDYGSRLPTQLP
jgi:tricorn protease